MNSFDDVKIFNESALLFFDKDNKAKLLSLFIKESTELIDNIIKSNSNNNIKDVLFYIHSIKGISRICCLQIKLAHFLFGLMNKQKNISTQLIWLAI